MLRTARDFKSRPGPGRIVQASSGLLLLPLSAQQWWTSPPDLWDQKHAKSFFLKGPASVRRSAPKISSTLMPSSQLMHFPEVEISLCFFQACKAIPPLTVPGCPEGICPAPPITPAQVRKPNQQWQTEGEELIHVLCIILPITFYSTLQFRARAVQSLLNHNSFLLLSTGPGMLGDAQAWGKEKNGEKRAKTKAALLTAKTRHAAANCSHLARMVSSSAMQKS